MKVLTASAGVSYAQVGPGRPRLLRVGAVQHRWHPDPTEHRAALAEGVRLAAGEGARLVCLQELTLSPYFAVTPDGPRPGVEPEPLEGGRPRPSPPSSPLRRASTCTRPCGRPARPDLGTTPPSSWHPTGGWHQGPASSTSRSPPATTKTATSSLGQPRRWPVRCRSTVPSSASHLLGPVVPELARAYALAGTDVLVYPTAIGSEPDHPSFDTEPCGRRSSSATGSPTARSWLPSTGSAPKTPFPSTVRRSSPTLWPQAGPGAAGRAGCARGRPRSRAAGGLAHAVSVPDHSPPEAYGASAPRCRR